MPTTLEQLRKERDARERQEYLERMEAMRTKLLPLLVSDLKGELSEEDGRTLLEICDDFEIRDREYDAIREAALRIAQDNKRIVALKPRVQHESQWMAELALNRRRAEVAASEARASAAKQQSLRKQLVGYSQCLADYRNDYAFLFEATDEVKVLESVASLPTSETPAAPPKPQKQCPICLSHFDADRDSDYCSGRCESIANEHHDIYVEMGVLPKQKKGKKS